MINPKEQCCFNCTYCLFEVSDFTPTGKLRKNSTGRCVYEIKMPKLPISVYQFIEPKTGGITADMGKDCKCFDFSQECIKGGNHVWGDDKFHTNVFCVKCFITKD